MSRAKQAGDERASEMFYEVGGRREDADLHATMLDDQEPAQAAADLASARRAALATGADPAVVDQLWGPAPQTVPRTRSSPQV